MSRQRLRFIYMLEVTQQQGMRVGKEVLCLHRHLERNNFSTEEGVHEKGGTSSLDALRKGSSTSQKNGAGWNLINDHRSVPTGTRVGESGDSLLREACRLVCMCVCV